jgi:hypothetical protein
MRKETQKERLNVHLYVIFQTSVVALTAVGHFSPSSLFFAPWAHRGPRDLHAGDSFSVVFCSSPLTRQASGVRPNSLKDSKPNGHDGEIWISSAPRVGIACLQMHCFVRCHIARGSSDDSPMASGFRDLEPDANGRGGGDDRLREPRDLDDILPLVRTRLP